MCPYGLLTPRLSRRIPCLLAVAALLCTSAAATAGTLSPTFFRIDVESALGSEYFEVLTSDPEVTFDPNTSTWNWTGQGISLGDVATLNSAFLTIVGDPQIGLGFAMTAGGADTTVTISSAVLSFGALVNPDALANTGVTLTETGGDPTATLMGLGGDYGNAYAAYYNVPPGTVFAEFIPELHTSTSVSESDGTAGFIPIADTVTSMQAQFSFTLTAQDQAGATSNFVIVPEPAGFALLALGGLALRRYRG